MYMQKVLYDGRSSAVISSSGTENLPDQETLSYIFIERNLQLREIENYKHNFFKAFVQFFIVGKIEICIKVSCFGSKFPIITLGLSCDKVSDLVGKFWF